MFNGFIGFLIPIGVICLIESGYLYSDYTNSFVCRPNKKDVKDGFSKNAIGSRPVLFTIERSKNVKQMVIGADNKHPRALAIVIDAPDHVKLIKGNKCETAFENTITPRRCTKSKQQKYRWIPERYFSKYVDILKKKSEKEEMQRNSKNDRTIKEEKSKIERIKGMMSDIKGNIGVKIHEMKDRRHKHKRKNDKSYSKNNLQDNRLDCKSENRPFHNDDKSYSKNNLQNNRLDCKSENRPFHNDDVLLKFIEFYKSNDPMARIMQKPEILEGFKNKSNLCPKEGDTKECNHLQGLMKSSIGPLDADYLKSIDSIVRDLGNSGVFDPEISGSYKSSENRPRERGIFAQGEDVEDLGDCRCKMECVKNPKNGSCYYKANTEGKLIPIMRDSSCCKESIHSSACNFKNPIDKHVCELLIYNDYSSFSKFLDDNYSYA